MCTQLIINNEHIEIKSQQTMDTGKFTKVQRNKHLITVMMLKIKSSC